MQTILGAGGAIGTLLAQELHKYTNQIRLVSRNPKKVNETDEVFPCNLLDKENVQKALHKTEIAYLIVGLKYDFKTWKREWPLIMQNVIDASLYNNCKLVFLDNVYMYGENDIVHIKENSTIDPPSKKGKVRAQIANMLLNAITNKRLKGMIARSADFYGPNVASSALKIGVVDNLIKGKKPFWQANANKIHSMTYTPDIAKALAILGNTPDAYGEVWHLPTSKEKLTGGDYIQMIAKRLNKSPEYSVYKKGFMQIVSIFSPMVKELCEMLYQYDRDYFFDSSKFENTFNFKPTTYQNGMDAIIEDLKNSN